MLLPKPSFHLRSSAASDIGQRSNNEDAYLVDDSLGLYVVADGMGGHDKGEVASWFSTENLQRIVHTIEQPQHDDTMDDPLIELRHFDRESLLQYAVFMINRQLFEQNAQHLAQIDHTSPHANILQRRRMGTTLVSLLFRERRAFVSNVGDSRAYRLSNHRLQLLTHDHSWVEEQLRAGALSPEEAAHHHKRHLITRSVGLKPEVNADIDAITIFPHERFLLCSDGLSNAVGEDDLLRIGTKPDIAAACRELVDLATQNGGRDNITVVLVEVGSERMPSVDEETVE